MARNFPAGRKRTRLVEFLSEKWNAGFDDANWGEQDHRADRMEPIYNINISTIESAFRAASVDAEFEDLVINNLVTAANFWEALKDMDEPFTDEELAWLMDPIGPDHPWMNNLSDGQKAMYFMQNWTVNKRNLYGAYLSRLEYWSVPWMEPEAPSTTSTTHLQISFGPLIVMKGENPPFNADYDGWSSTGFNVGQAAEKDIVWAEAMRSRQAAELEAAAKIIWTIWGVCYAEGGTSRELAKEGAPRVNEDFQGTLFKDKSNWTTPKMQFLSMLCMNQGFGNHTQKQWGKIGPWHQHGEANQGRVPDLQWLATGSEEGYEPGENSGNPVNYSILQKLLHSEAGYNKPFALENMSWMEIMAFTTPEEYESDGVTMKEGSLATQRRFLTTYTASTFMETIIKYLKSDDKHKIWDGKLSNTTGETAPMELRDGSLFNEGELSPVEQLGEKSRPTWVNRDSKDDRVDWDVGLFYSQTSKQDQIDELAKFYEYSAPDDWGLTRLLAWTMPRPGNKSDNYWMYNDNALDNTSHTHRNWEEYRELMFYFIQGSQRAYQESTEEKLDNLRFSSNPNASYGGVSSDLLSVSSATPGDTAIGVEASSGVPKYPTFKPWLKDSGFANWEGWVKNNIAEEMELSTRGKGAAGPRAAGMEKEIKDCFVPNKVSDGDGVGTKEWPSSGFNGNFADDVNNLPGADGKMKGSFWEAAPNSDNEEAKKNIDGFKELFLEVAGSKDKGRGPKEPKATAQWFRDNFTTNSLIPKDPTKTALLSLDVRNSDYPQETKDALKSVFTTEIVNFEKESSPWSIFKYSGYSGEATLMPFEEIIRMYQGAAYLAILYYQKEKKLRNAPGALPDSDTGVQVLIHKVWEHYAFKCAYHIYRVWEKILHDNIAGNLYAAICVLAAEADLTDPAVLDAAKAIADMIEEAHDESMKGVAEEPPPTITDDDIEVTKDQRERFYKQCALMLNMHMLDKKWDMRGVMHEKSIEAGYSSYNGRIHLLTDADGETQKNTILNKMVTPKPSSMKSFINIKPDKAAELLPYVRFFRVWNDNDGNLKEIEFDFPKFPRRDLSGKFDRGDGVGLQEFAWECDGETPATASKYINATMTISFQTFDDFTRKRKNKAGNEFRWVDMFVSPTNVITKPGKAADTPVRLKYDSEYYRIRVDVGYHTDNDMSEVLASQNRSFFLVLKDNEITINPDMSVTIQASYGAYIEEAMDSNKFNALTTPTIRSTMEKYKAMWLEATEAHKKDQCSDNALRDLRSTINAELETLIKKQHKSIMTNLLNLEKIYYVDFDADPIDDYRQRGSFRNIPTFKNSNSLSPSSNPAKALKAKIDAQDDPDRLSWEEAKEPHKDYRVYYFYLGDLIYLINSAMYEGYAPWESKGLFDGQDVYVSGAENTKILLMDFDYQNPLVRTDTSRRSINIAHIPISVDFFFQWYVNNIIKNEVYNIGVGNFLKKILSELITEAMAEICLSSEEGSYVSFQHGSISVAGVSIERPDDDPLFTDPITSMMMFIKESAADPYIFDVNDHYGKRADRGDMSLPFRFIPDELALKQHNKNGVQGQYQYVYIYADSSDPNHVGRGDEKKDNERGCYHLHLAKDSGLVKNISFSKNNIPYLRESRMFNQGQAGLLQLSAVYDCEIQMIGNTLFLPGQEVWVNPYGFGGETFGKPQDKPLSWSPAAQDIDKVNDLQRQADADGVRENAEKEKIADQLDSIDAGVTAGMAKKKDPDTGAVNVEVNSYANVMGIGGYQLIIRTKTSIKPGDFTTTINAKHTFTGYPSINQSLDMVEFRDGRPKSIADADDRPDAPRCAGVIIEQDIE
mgnify:CR=1 FL=1